MMVALKYFFDEGKDVHWIAAIERGMSKFSSIQGLELAIVLTIILIFASIMPAAVLATFLYSAVAGLVTFMAVDVLGHLLDKSQEGMDIAVKGGLGAFLYLEVLDASFSFDGVIGAFALTQNLFLIAIGLALGFKAGIWNIGAEGQYIMGAICGAAVGLAVYPTESRWIFPAMVLAGAFGGWAWAMIPAILKTRFNTNEILVSLMLVYVAQTILAKASTGFLKNPEGMGFPGSRNFSSYPAAANPEFWPGSGIHWGVVVALGVALVAPDTSPRGLGIEGEDDRCGGVQCVRVAVWWRGTQGWHG
jgi:ABC-type uncharacterized transport system permease subunit